MSIQWLVSVSKRPPFVSVKRYRPKTEVYLVHLADLGAVWRQEPLKIGISDTTKDSIERDMKYAALYSYHLNTPGHKITDIT